MIIFLKKVPKLLGTFCLLICFSCKQNFYSLKKHRKENGSEAEARYNDIGIPLGIIHLKAIDLGFEYYASLNFTELAKFYDESMELYGWQILVKSKNIIIYEKPYKLAIIEICESNKLQKIKIRSVPKNFN